METKIRSVFVIGDSISIHYGPYLKELIQGQFNYDRKRGVDEALENLDKPIGANAGDSNMVLKYLQEEMDKQVKYDILLLNCGLHDIRVDRGSMEIQIKSCLYERNLEEIINLAKKMAKVVIWVNTTPIIDKVHNSRNEGFLRFSKDLKIYNEIAEKIMVNQNIRTIDLYDFTSSLGEDIYWDHVHFKKQIRKLQAAYIAGHLNNFKCDL